MSRVAATLLLGVAVATCASAAPAKTNGLLVFDSVGVSGNNDLFVVGAGGAGLTNLTRTATNEETPRWSPDGSRIAFRAAADNGLAPGDIDVVAADGSGLVDLTPDPADEFLPRWSPDGTRIAFLVAPAKPTRDHIGDLVVIGADGTGRKQVTTGAPVDDDTYDWSPDSTRLVFADAPGHLMVVGADGTGLHRVKTPGPGLHPAWSPNGKRIAFAGSPTWPGGAGIWTVTTAGTAPRRVTHPSLSHDYEPTWSPDATRIVFQRDPDTNPLTLDVVRAGGGPSHSISRGLALGDDPVWSLDGRRIVFVGGGRKREPRRDLYVVDRDGTHRRLIAKGPDINLVSWQVR